MGAGKPGMSDKRDQIAFTINKEYIIARIGRKIARDYCPLINAMACAFV
jgi:hypothetical protein